MIECYSYKCNCKHRQIQFGISDACFQEQDMRKNTFGVCVKITSQVSPLICGDLKFPAGQQFHNRNLFSTLT